MFLYEAAGYLVVATPFPSEVITIDMFTIYIYLGPETVIWVILLSTTEVNAWLYKETP